MTYTDLSSGRLSDELRQVIYTHHYIVRLSRSTAGQITHCRKQGWGASEQMLTSFRARLMELNTSYSRLLTNVTATHPMRVASAGVWGVGPVLLFRLLYWIDWNACPTPASLWSYCGYGVFDGKSQYKAAIYNSKPHAWSIGASNAVLAIRSRIVRKKSPYRKILKSRMDYERNVNFLPENICYKRARRYTTKRWLLHLWVVGRTVYGLPTGEPHPLDPYSNPLDFGWSYGDD